MIYAYTYSYAAAMMAALEPCLDNLSFWQGDNDFASNLVENKVDGGSSIAVIGGNILVADGITSSIKTTGLKDIDQQYYYYAVKIKTPPVLKDQGISGHSYAGSANRSGFYIVGTTLNFIWQLVSKTINVNVNTLITTSTVYDAVVIIDRLGNLEFWLDGTRIDALTSDVDEGTLTLETFANDFRVMSYGTSANTDLASFASNCEYFHVKYGSGQLTLAELQDSSLIKANIYDSNFSEGKGNVNYNKSNGAEYVILGSTWDISNEQKTFNHQEGFDLWQNDSDENFLRVPFTNDDDSIKTYGDTITGYSFVARCISEVNIWNRSESSFELPESGVLDVEGIKNSLNVGSTLFFRKINDKRLVQKLFATPIEEELGTYGYRDELTSNLSQARGSNYMQFVSADENYIELYDLEYDNGDVISFFAKSDVPATDAYIMSNSSARQIKFAGGTNNFVTFISDNFLTFATGVDVSTWNHYSLHLESTRIGLSVNNGAINWQNTTNLDNNAAKWIARQSSVYSDISLFGFQWVDINGNYKVKFDLIEGYGVPYDTSSLNKFARACTANWSYDESLNPLALINGIRYENTHVNVIVLAGQSNAVGDPDMISLGLPYVEPIGQLKASCEAGVYYDLGSIKLNNSSQGSVELKASLRLLENDEKVLFIKVAFPGSEIADWQKGQLRYTEFETCVNRAKADLTALGLTYTIREFWWLQGESDASDTIKANSYSANFQSMYNNMIGDGLIPIGLNIRIAKLSNTPYAFESVINSQYEDIINTYQGSLIETSSFAKQVDNIHYTPESYIGLGDSFADVYLAENYQIVQTETKQLIPAFTNILSADNKDLDITDQSGFGDVGAIIDNIKGLANGATFEEIKELSSDNYDIVSSEKEITSLQVYNTGERAIDRVLDYSIAPTEDCGIKTLKYVEWLVVNRGNVVLNNNNIVIKK